MNHQYDGWISIPHSTYDIWKSATEYNGYNADGYAGNQCWDFCAELWYQYGLTLYTGPNGYAYECWTVSKNANARTPFFAVEGIENIKRGDCIVLSPITSYPAGHIAFADEDYNGTNWLNILGQHQGESDSAATSFVNVTNFEIGSRFLGIFRNSEWQVTPPAEETKKKKFPYPVAWQHWPNFKRFK